MRKGKNPLATVLGVYAPTQFVVAAIDDPATATGALAALKAAGFADAAVELCPGRQFLKNDRDFVAHRSLGERADRDRVRDILAAHGGHAMRYYGDNAITDLT